MVDNNNIMTADDFDQLIADNPPGTPAPDPESQNNAGSNNDSQTQQQNTESTTDVNTDDTTSDTGADDSGNAGDVQPANSKANEAFAQMRITNRKMQQALQAVLEQHGIDPNLASDPDKLIADAENAKLEEEAKKQNVPTELLQRLTQLEKRDLENQQKRLADAALAGFQAVKNKYNLTNKDISDFAKQLQEAGTNPFEREMDLDLQYRVLNIETIIEKEKKKAVEEALKNQNFAEQHSSQPSNTQGKDFSGTEQIDTMAKFDRFLQSLNN